MLFRSSTTSFTSSTTASTNGTSTSIWPGSTNNATFVGSRFFYIPMTTTITDDMFWVGMQRSSTTAGAAVAGSFSNVVMTYTTYDSNSRWAPLGFATTASHWLLHPAGNQANGMLTATYNATSNYVGSGVSAGAIAKSNVLWSGSTTNTGTFSRF